MNRRPVQNPYRRQRLHQHVRDMHSELKYSAWSRRAWTFQEQIYSRRVLVFAGQHVAWECHCSVFFEGLDVPHGDDPGEGCQKNTDVVAKGFSFGRPARFVDYTAHVMQYNPRALTFPEDALNAFAGILQTLGSVFVGGFIRGLPVMFFDAAILWHNSDSLKRRRERKADHQDSLQPTWSWAGWEGAVTFPTRGMKSLVRWDTWNMVKKGWQSVTSEEELEPTEMSEELAVLVAKRGSYLLRATAQRCLFWLEPPEGLWSMPADKTGHCAGVLTSCENIHRGNRPPADSLCELIVVSEATQDGETIVNVIWIEREGDIAYRKGVGRIYQSSWEAPEPRDWVDYSRIM